MYEVGLDEMGKNKINEYKLMKEDKNESPKN